MPNYLRAYRDKTASADPGTPIRFIASTENVARDGLVISADGWDLDHFRANPTFLWSHDYTGARPPIGRVTDIQVKGKELIAEVMFDQGDDFARQIERKYRDGFLNAVSVGWETKMIEPPSGASGVPRVARAELLDLSGVNIPGDPNALIQRQLRALQDLANEPDPLLTATEPVRATWDEVAASMVRLIVSPAQRPDEERTKAYRVIARDYARHGKTPPELLDAEVIAALDADQIRGLFLNGEPDLYPVMFDVLTTEQRAGAVLSKRNADDLQRAIELLQGVAERAAKEASTPEPEPIVDETARSLFTAAAGFLGANNDA